MISRIVSESVRTGWSADHVSSAPPASAVPSRDTKSTNRTPRNRRRSSSRRAVLLPTWNSVPSGSRTDATSSSLSPLPVRSVAQVCSPLSSGVLSCDRSNCRQSSGMLKNRTSRSDPSVRTNSGPWSDASCTVRISRGERVDAAPRVSAGELHDRRLDGFAIVTGAGTAPAAHRSGRRSRPSWRRRRSRTTARGGSRGCGGAAHATLRT